jgi:PAS domain S-box-containing protein
MLEDSSDDAALTERTLLKAGYAIRTLRVDTRRDFVEALDSFHPDLILADYNLPDFDGLTAIKLVRERSAQVPLVLLTGALDDEAAVEVVKAGAHDYVRKDRRARLPIAVANAFAASTAERERVEAARDLRQSMLEIEDLYNKAPCGYHSVDRDLVVLSINDTELAWLGYQRAEVVGVMRIADLLTPKSAAKFRDQAFPRLLAGGEISNLEVEMLSKGKTILPVLLNSTAITAPDGSYLRSRTTVNDISRLKAAEQREQLAANDLRNILYSTHVATFVLDGKFGIRFLTPAGKSLLGVTPGDLGPVLFHKLSGSLDVLAESTKAEVELLADAAAVVENHQPVEREIHAQSGAWYVRRILPYRTEDGFDGIVITFIDVTERRRLAEKLETTRQHAEDKLASLHTILDGMPSGIIITDNDGNVVNFNAAARLASGIDRSTSRTHKGRSDPTNVEDWAVEFGLHMADGITPLAFELNPLVRALRGEDTDQTDLYVARPDGSGSHMSVSGRTIRMEDGSISGGFVVMSDITRLVDRAERLHNAAFGARSIIEAILDPTIAINGDGKITNVNKAVEAVTGLTRSRLIGSNFADCFTDPEKARTGCLQAFEREFISDYPLTMHHAFGGLSDVLCNARVYRDDNGSVVGVLATTGVISKDKHNEDGDARIQALRQSLRGARS